MILISIATMIMRKEYEMETRIIQVGMKYIGQVKINGNWKGLDSGLQAWNAVEYQYRHCRTWPKSSAIGRTIQYIDICGEE
jgi:hypothetical protein